MPNTSTSQVSSQKRAGRSISATDTNRREGRRQQSRSLNRIVNASIIDFNGFLEAATEELNDYLPTESGRKTGKVGTGQSIKQLRAKLSNIKELIHRTETSIKLATQDFFQADSDYACLKAEIKVDELQSTLKRLRDRQVATQAELEKILNEEDVD